MKNYLSKELSHKELQGDHSDIIKIIKKVYQAPLVAKESLTNMVYSRRDQ